MPSHHDLLTRFARRPLLMTLDAAQDLVHRLRAADPRGMKSEGRLLANLRKLNIFRPSAMEDDDYKPREPAKPACYTPLWAQQAYGEPEDEGFCWSLYHGVAMMEVNGPLAERGDFWCGTWYHGYDTVLAGLREAMADPRVQAIFVRMACPGGPVAGGLPALAQFVRENNAAAGGKPVHFYADMACSAGYWGISGGDRIHAPAVGLVGSIGAVIVHEDYSGLYEQAGVKVEAIQFGEAKTDGAHWKPLSAGARADLQAEIDQCGRDFIAGVVAGRPQLTSEILLGTQARVFMAEHDEDGRSGRAIGFVDDIMTEEDAFGVLLDDIAARSTGVSTAAGLSGGAAQASMETDMIKAAQIKGKTAAQTKTDASSSSDDGQGDGAVIDNDDDSPDTDDVETEQEAAEVGDDGAEQPNAAAAIAASAEAKTHPQLALAAISSGQTLAQFQASAAAIPAPAAGGRRVGALDAAMAGVKRVGVEASSEAATTMGGILLANAKAKKAKA